MRRCTHFFVMIMNIQNPEQEQAVSTKVHKNCSQKTIGHLQFCVQYIIWSEIITKQRNEGINYKVNTFVIHGWSRIIDKLHKIFVGECAVNCWV